MNGEDDVNGKNATSPEPIVVAFTKDWNDVPTCTTHLLRQMGRTLPVLWIGSIGTRKPGKGSAKDWRRIVGRLLHGFRPPDWKEHHLYVLHPLLIPKASCRMAIRLNACLFRWHLSRARRRMGVPPSAVVEYWCFVPNAVDLLPARSKSGYERVVYYCADDWTSFRHLDGTWMREKELALIKRADHIFATAPFLVDKLKGMQQDAGLQGVRPPVYMSHGVDYEAFAKALDRTLPVPPDIAALPHPVIGFYGNLHAWVDFALIQSLAEARPGWSFVLIGENYAAPDSLSHYHNMHLLGRREHAELPSYCRGFDVAIIPYDMRQHRMESVNPVKTKELLAAGLPVVAADVPVLRTYGDVIRIGLSRESWLDALERQLALDQVARRAISASVQGESWQEKALQIRAYLNAPAP